jgi:hypothetical protein
MAKTPKSVRKDMAKGATLLRAIRSSDAGIATSGQKKLVSKSLGRARTRVLNGNIPVGRTPKEAASERAKNKGIVKEASKPSMKLKAAMTKKAATVAKNKTPIARFKVVANKPLVKPAKPVKKPMS